MKPEVLNKLEDYISKTTKIYESRLYSFEELYLEHIKEHKRLWEKQQLEKEIEKLYNQIVDNSSLGLNTIQVAKLYGKE